MSDEKLKGYAKKQARMKADPEYAERIREEWRRANERRYAKETPEEREKRMQRNREKTRKSYQKRKAALALLPKPEKPKPDRKHSVATKKPGRLMALAGWLRW